MKKISLLYLVLLVNYVAFSQTSINWVSTIELEKSLENGNNEYFILLVNENDKNIRHDSELLMNKDLVKYVNKNFICYKFDISSNDFKFQDKFFAKKKKDDVEYHSFANYLVAKNLNGNNSWPIVVLRDKNFNLYSSRYSSSDQSSFLLKFAKNSVSELINRLDYFRSGKYRKKSQN
jgi:hypothetical protein